MNIGAVKNISVLSIFIVRFLWNTEEEIWRNLLCSFVGFVKNWSRENHKFHTSANEITFSLMSSDHVIFMKWRTRWKIRCVRHRAHNSQSSFKCYSRYGIEITLCFKPLNICLG